MEPYLYEGKATGALPREPRPGDWQLDRLPEVRELLAAGLPSSFVVRPLESIPDLIKLDQGPIPKCVASSTCISKSLQEFADLQRWQAYNDQELYQACGGTGSTGIYTDTCLAYARDTGVLVADGSRRYRIASYMFAPRVRQQFRETLAAALIATGPCVVAMILPASFGWHSSGLLQGPQSYHQMCLVGYEGLEDGDWAVFLNSWGPGFGQNGFARVMWEVIETGGTFQQVGGYQYAYAYQLADFVDGSVKPEPSPEPVKKIVRVGGILTGEGAERVLENTTLGVSGSGFVGSLAVDTVTLVEVKPEPRPKPEPEPEPPPGELVIEAGPGWRGSLEVKVRRGQEYVVALVSARAGPVDYGRRTAIARDGRSIVAARFAMPAKGTVVEITATAGNETGKGTYTA